MRHSPALPLVLPQVTQFPGGVHKSFKSREEAEAWLRAPVSAPAPRRHTLGPAQVTGSSLGSPSPYRHSPRPRHSMSPQGFNSFSSSGILAPATPQAYSSSLEGMSHLASGTVQQHVLATPQSDASRQWQQSVPDEEGEDWPEEGSEGSEGEAEGSGNPALGASHSQRDGRWYTLEFDGASKGNPGPGGAGAVLRDPGGAPILYITQGIVSSTSNRAEYCALIAGLEEAFALGISRLRVQGDSQLVICQCQGLWAVRHPALAALNKQALELLEQFQEVELRHVPREWNTLADQLSNDAVVLPHGERRKATTYHGGF